jgi:serine/threonine protein phosphatase 1
MIYVMSDMHGCYDKYSTMLDKIGFCDDDTLFVVGDAIDFGPEPIRILTDMSCRSNVYPILGDHEYTARKMLKLLGGVASDKTPEDLTADDIKALKAWLADGGATTLEAFRALEPDEREGILDYLEEFAPYEIAEAGGHVFVLVHAGLAGYRPDRELDTYTPEDFIYEPAALGKRYFKNAYLVTGHTPTYKIDEKYRGRIYSESGRLAIDCGAAHGERLGCVCLDTGKAYYI